MAFSRLSGPDHQAALLFRNPTAEQFISLLGQRLRDFWEFLYTSAVPYHAVGGVRHPAEFALVTEVNGMNYMQLPGAGETLLLKSLLNYFVIAEFRIRRYVFFSG